MPMDLHVKKLFDGKFVDIKDYEREQCLTNNETCVIHHDNKTMTLTPKKLRKGIMKISTQVYKNQVKGRPDYKILSYTWVPDVKE
jgi:hypothetical protein